MDLNNIVKYISSDDAEIPLKDIFDEYSALIYEYDFGDNWEIIVTKTSDIEYNNKTALITDFNGKYNPIDDLGGPIIFDEIMGVIEDDEELKYVLEEYIKSGRIIKNGFWKEI